MLAALAAGRDPRINEAEAAPGYEHRSHRSLRSQ